MRRFFFELQSCRWVDILKPEILRRSKKCGVIDNLKLRLRSYEWCLRHSISRPARLR
jgi:hypothetical protein